MGMSRRQYAAHRGVSHTAVGKAISSGRISLEPDGSIDPVTADRQWDAQTDPAKQRGAHARALGTATAAGTSRASAATRPVPRAAIESVGETLREVHKRDADALQKFGIDFTAALILGGQIGREQPRLFQIYAAGNFIEATPDTPYFQIGESKYGKPIIDRVVKRHTTLDEAAKLALISMDSTIRSNLSVGLPLDLTILETDRLQVSSHISIDAQNEYFAMIRSRWSQALGSAFEALPSPDWIGAGEVGDA
jgi:putative proteasome-type protease